MDEPPTLDAREPGSRGGADEVGSGLTGVWTVAGHWRADVSALAEEEAEAWRGRSLRLVDWEALVPGNRCAQPAYRTESLSAEAFVSRFDSWPADLILPVTDGRVEVMTVTCDGSDWVAPGATMIRVDADRALTVWDGVFFALDRDHQAEAVDFRAVGNEPGWLLEVVEGERIRFRYDYGESEAFTPAPEPEIAAETGGITYHAVTEAVDLRVEILPESCLDDMSGFPFPTTVSVTLGDRTFRGCGGPRPDTD
ncbi:MAG TPA: hypothetical protein VML95_02665 [Longimicrobiales bacterium]|nr:hypothetical protein [Longimicrobiales bacterium]